MKTKILVAAVIVAATCLAIYAQQPGGAPYSGKSPKEPRRVVQRPGFVVPEMETNDRQRDELRQICTEQIRERTRVRNIIREKNAALESLQTADKPDMTAINRAIDEIATIRTQYMKGEAVRRQKIRSILTDAQRAHYDAQCGNCPGRLCVWCPDTNTPCCIMQNQRPDNTNPCFAMQNLRPDTTNPCCAMQNPRPDTTNPCCAMQNQRPDATNPCCAMQNQRPDATNPRCAMQNLRPDNI